MSGERAAPPPAADSSDAALDAARLRGIDSATLLRFLHPRRWFGVKGRAIASARVADVIPVRWPAGRFAVARVVVEAEGFGSASYQLPLAAHAAATPPEHAVAVVPIGDRAVSIVDATDDARFLAGLGVALTRGDACRGDGARWELVPLGAPADLGSLVPRVLRGEQSNTSIVYGERSIVKLFRRLEPGEHPEVEITRFLTTRTEFRHAPALEGTIGLHAASGEGFVAGMRSAFVPHATDGWAHALDAAGRYLRSSGPERAPADSYGEEARRLGVVTRALHDALASHPDAPGFGVEPVTASDVDAWAARLNDAVRRALARLAQRSSALDARTAPMARAIAARGPALEERVEAIARDARTQASGQVRSRLHGDYHLGQVLRTADGDWMILDFEGEPARPLAERRALASPLRDVAGMLRSYAYAAATAAAAVGGLGVNPLVEVRAAHWEHDARAAFLDGCAARDGDPLLALFEIEKLFYELEYELDHRPDWTWIPLRGIAKLF